MPEENGDIWSETDRTLPRKPGEEEELDPEEYYRAGLFLLKRDRLKESYQAFKRSFEARGADPRYMSYYGLMLAKVGGRLKEGLILCERAAEKEFYRSELFYNLSQVYMLVGNRRKAYETLRKGLSLDKSNKDIVRELEKMGIRRPPVFPFLDRKNAINMVAGKVLYKLRLRR